MDLFVDVTHDISCGESLLAINELRILSTYPYIIDACVYTYNYIYVYTYLYNYENTYQR